MINRGTLFGSYVEHVKKSLDFGMVPSVEVCKNLINIIEILDAQLHNRNRVENVIDAEFTEKKPQINVTMKDFTDWIKR